MADEFDTVENTGFPYWETGFYYIQISCGMTLSP